MSSKGSSSYKLDYVSRAYGSSGRFSNNTILNKYLPHKENTLEEIVTSHYKKIDEKLEIRARTLLKYFTPGLYHGLLFAEFLYRHKEVIVKTIANVAQIWSKGDTPVSEKVITTLEEIVKGGTDIAKKELRDNMISYVSSEFAEEAVGILEEKGIVNTVVQEVKLENHKERFKDLLNDTIEQQTEGVLTSLMEEKR